MHYNNIDKYIWDRCQNTLDSISIMAASSAEFLDVEDDRRQRSLHRSRSGGYADHIEEKTNWDRHKKEMQMKRYHESRYGGSPTTPQQRSTADRLTVPVFETNTKRNRSSSDVSRRQPSTSSRYNLQEVRPSYDYDLISEAPLPSQLPVLRERRPPSQPPPEPPSQTSHQRKPSIKVEIHQDKKPVPRLTMTPTVKTPTSARTPTRSLNASPRSGSKQPQLLYQYSTLQNKLSQITTTCGPFLKVEAASPGDLTFEKIAEQVKGVAFDLHIWSHTVGLESMEMIDSRKRDIVEATARNLDRMLDRVTELNEVCSDAKPRDLKLAEPPKIDDENLFKDDGEDDE